MAGRAKDIMIAAGHNYYPEDFEWAAGRVEGIRPGEVVVLPPGTVQKTTSGKLRRAAMRRLYVSGALGDGEP